MDKKKKSAILPRPRSVSDFDDRILEADWLEETEEQMREAEEYYINSDLAKPDNQLYTKMNEVIQKNAKFFADS